MGQSGLGLQVTNLSEHALELRCLMSARNSSDQFDLRCVVREKMMTYIQENYPETLTRTRFSAIATSHADRASMEETQTGSSQTDTSQQGGSRRSLHDSDATSLPREGQPPLGRDDKVIT